MKTLSSFYKNTWLIIIFFVFSQNTFATHAQSADITYQCLGTNQYQISVSFYRDCSGVNAPNTISINTFSTSCNQNFNTTLSLIAGTGTDVTPICNSITTVCNGGSTPGVEEYIYRGIINLPMSCNDWTFSFSLCCRNNAINTINNPGGENIYVEAKLNNLDFTCNNSPTFSNPPVSFPCVGQTSCFNHGAIEPDGDSLYYSLISPATGPATFITYNAGYSAQQPLTASIPTTFNSFTGDICITPSLQEVTVLAVKVEEWRNGIFIGSVVRDIQLRTIVCNNTLPFLSGINGLGQFSINACAGTPLTFNIPSADADAGQTVTINWNNGIPNASFTNNGAQIPTGVFNWTPNTSDISTTPHCFTVIVSDDNCPFNGEQIYSFCITVGGFTISTTSTTANCGASNGSATATITGGTPPFTYQWMPNGGNNATANGLTSGTYSVNVTDANGCSSSNNIVVGSGALPGNITISSTDINCFGGNNGSATVNINGGQQPHTYLWSNGDTNSTINGLIAGTYLVTATSNSGCLISDTIIITEPTFPLVITTTQTNPTCFGGNDGSATVIPSGGTIPYTFFWNTIPVQNNLTATGLNSGPYTVVVVDANGCNISQDINISQPQPLNISIINLQNINCFNGNNGEISVNVNGGTTPYSYNWNNYAFTNNSIISNLIAGAYLLNITDSNGCTATNQYTITEPSELTTSIITTTNITCNGLQNGTIFTTTTGGTPPYSYQWNASASTLPHALNLDVGYHKLTVNDNYNCMDTISKTITEPSIVTTILSGADTICPNQNLTLTATGFGGAGNYTYQWNNGNTGNTQIVSPTSQTTYTVFATDANGCVGTVDSANVLVNNISLVNLSTVPDTILCEGSSYIITATINGGIGTYSYHWNNGLGQGQGPFIVTPLSSINYIITVTDNCGNSINETVLINVNPLPLISLQSETKTACGDVTLNLSNINSNPISTTYFWDFGDGSFSSQEHPIKTYTKTGIYTVVLTGTSPQGCINVDQANMNITTNPIPVSQFDFDPKETDILNALINFDNYSVDSDFYNWNFGDGTTSIEKQPTHNYEKDGTYIITLIASNIFGCKDTIMAELLVEPHFNFYIPNAFTPDGNGRNDIFTAVGEEIEIFNMQIFNRWGELIYETNSLEKGWDGSAKNGSEISLEGVYVYNIQLQDWQGLNHKFIGHVSLLK